MKIVDGWLSTAKEYNINENSWDRGGIKATHLVIHGTAGGSEGAGTMRYMKSVGVSTHFAISTNGDIWQGVSCNRAAWGNSPLKSPRIPFARADKNPNLWTISIEFCKPDGTNQINITDKQKQSGFPLIKTICEAYNIPKRAGDDAGGVISHADVNSVDRSRCPGPFPWQELWSYLKEDQHPQEEVSVLQIDQVSDYFLELEDGKRWRCKVPSSHDGKTHDIAYGLLEFYRTFGQTGLNGLTIMGLPLTEEYHILDAKQTVVQLCERAVMVYDPLHELDTVPGLGGPCYLAHIDVGPVAELLHQPIVQMLTDKNKALQAELRKCLDTQAQEPSRRALHQIYQIAQAFEQKEV